LSIAHFFVGFFILFLIESGMATHCKQLFSKIWQFTYPEIKENLELDEDVVAEEKRIQHASPEDAVVKVQNFRKVYMTGKGPCNPGKPLLAVEQLSFGLQ